jgi:hypothetical protein
MTMRYMMMVKSTENAGPPPQALMDAMGKLIEDATKSGQLIESGGLASSSRGTRVGLRGGKLSVTDGPFTEAKEVFGGYAVFEFKSKKEATDAAVSFMELHARHWPGWEGETEIRQVTFLNGAQIGDDSRFGPKDVAAKA